MAANRSTIVSSTFSSSLALVLSVALLLATCLFALTIGSAGLGLTDIANVLACQWQADDSCTQFALQQRIVIELRLPRLLTATVTGAGLAISGAVLQAVTRNPLADPYLFGISAGASLGAVAAMVAIGGSLVSMTVGAFAGACLSVVLVITLAGTRAGRVEYLLLAGVAVSFMLSSATSLILYLAEPQAAANVLFWMMGSFSRSQLHHLPPLYLVFALAVMIFVAYSRQLNLMLAGDESAQTMGVSVHQLRLAMLLICSLLTATLVAQSGGIGFVGLMIPHIVRYLLGGEMTRTLVFSTLFGAIFMVWVDILSRSILADQVLPIGIITAALGSAFFIVILKLRQSRAPLT